MYVQTRLQAGNSTTTTAHDFRKTIPDYVRNPQNPNQYFGYDIEKTRKDIKISNQNHKIRYKNRYKRNPQQGKQSNFLQGIVTISSQFNSMNLEKEDIEKRFVQSLKNLEIFFKDYTDNLEIYYKVIHYDEKTPHLHFALSNHLKNGESFFHNLKNNKRIDSKKTSEKPLSKIQDLVAKPFIDLGFTRGIKKSNTRHLRVLEMHQEELKIAKEKAETIKVKKIELEYQKNKLEREVMELKKLKEDIKNEILITDSQKEILDFIKRENPNEKSIQVEKIVMGSSNKIKNIQKIENKVVTTNLSI